MAKAHYRVIQRELDYVAIIDQNGDGVSVTNDAEAVVAELYQREDLSGRHVIYKDTTGRWDELCHEEGVFIGFGPGGATLPEAVKRIVV